MSILYGNFTFHNGGTTDAELTNVHQHLVSFLVCAVVAYAANPSWRVEVYVDRLLGVLGLDGVAYLFSLLPVLTLVASGKGLHAVAVDFVAANHHFSTVVDDYRLVNGRGVLLLLQDFGQLLAGLGCISLGCYRLVVVALFRLGVGLLLAVHQFVDVLRVGDGQRTFLCAVLLLDALSESLRIGRRQTANAQDYYVDELSHHLTSSKRQ